MFFKIEMRISKLETISKSQKIQALEKFQGSIFCRAEIGSGIQEFQHPTLNVQRSMEEGRNRGWPKLTN